MTKPGHVLALIGVLAFATAAATNVGAQSSSYRGRRTADRLSGTYQLDRNQSDNPQQAVMRATRYLPADSRDRVYQSWITRLDSPQTLSIDVQGRSVTVVSSNAPKITFDADGQDRMEQAPSGRQIMTRADVHGNVLTVSTTGNRGSDYSAVFEPWAGGLRVTRTLQSEYAQSPLTIHSVYRRVQDTPRWNVDILGPTVLVPEGTELVARLDRDVNSRTTSDGQRVSVTVVNGQYRGAILDGSVAHAAPAEGKEEMSFNFDRIRLRDGRSANFSGQLVAVTKPNGEQVQVDREGDAQAQTRANGNQQLQNGAIGAGIGAIIGAIAGGGKGAAVGAVVGGGTGVLATPGHSLDLNLPAGTTLTVSALPMRYARGENERR